MTWSDFLKRTDLVGGEMVTYEGDDAYRGPISAIKSTDKGVTIESEWTERCSARGNGDWERVASNNPIYMSLEDVSSPQEDSDGRINFSLPFIGRGVITPKGWVAPVGGSDKKQDAESLLKILSHGTHYDWEPVASLNPRGYAEIRAKDGSRVYHGPIEKVKVNVEDVVEIHFRWLATASLNEFSMPDSDWKVAPSNMNPIILHNTMTPFVVEQTPEKGPRVRFGLNILYLNEVEGIHPSKVEGLEVS